MSSEFFRWLIPGVLAGGAHPDPFREPGQLASAMADLAQHGIVAVISVVEQPLALAGPDYLHAPTPDGEAPDDLEELCTFIDAARQRGTGTFVHCMAGQGRTGTVLAAYLIWSKGLRASEAVDEVRRSYHPLAVESGAQLQSLEAFARRHKLI